MIIAESCYDEMINATARSIRARVELYDGSTLLDTYTYDGALQSFVVERVGDANKFFGYGICQKLTVKLRDRERSINITKGQGMEVVVGVGCEYLYTCPIFFVEEVTRDENNNDLTITAYDAIYRATNHRASEVVLRPPYTILGMTNACAAVLGMPIKIERRNLLDLSKCNFGYCILNDDGSITSNVSNHYYSQIVTSELNNLLMESKGKSFTLSVGKAIPDRYCTIVIYGTRTNGATYQEANVLASDRVTITVANDFTEINNLELRFNRSLSQITDTTTTVPYIQFEEGSVATVYEPYNTAFSLSYETGANIEGTESIRDILDDIAEATGTIYYMNNNWELTFKRLDVDGDPVLHVDKSKYFTLASKTSLALETLVRANELGDNISVTTGNTGETQYIRDNVFWDLREDIATLLDDALAIVGGLTIAQFSCKWRGNFLLEIGDKISFTGKNGEVITSYLLNDTIKYDGGLVGNTQWEFSSSQGETASTPSTIGDALKQTYAKVDKVNKQIEMVVSGVEDNAESIVRMELNLSGINQTVAQTNQRVNTSIDGMNEEIAEITRSVSSKMSAEDVQLQISEAMNDGVNAVTTTTGFTFNEVGLTVSKSNSEMSTTITEDGMAVSRNETEVLVCDSTGVAARNLHANTYLIVGLYSRFENYGEHRTGCFWIG